MSRTVEKNGYTVTQVYDNNLYVSKDGKLIMHAICTERLSRKELSEYLDNMDKFLSMVRSKK